MSAPMTEHEREAFLAEPHLATISVARPDGRPPFAAPSMYTYAPGGAVTFFTGTAGQPAIQGGLLERARSITVSVQGAEPYRYVAVECDLVDADRTPEPERMLGILRRYLSWDAAQGTVAAELGSDAAGVVLYTAKPTRWFSAVFAETT